MEYDKKEKAKQIVKILEEVTYHDWSILENIINDTYNRKNLMSNFNGDKITHNRIDSWF